MSYSKQKTETWSDLISQTMGQEEDAVQDRCEWSCDGHMTHTRQSHENSHFSKLELFLYGACVFVCVFRSYILSRKINFYQMALYISTIQ